VQSRWGARCRMRTRCWARSWSGARPTFGADGRPLPRPRVRASLLLVQEFPSVRDIVPGVCDGVWRGVAAWRRARYVRFDEDADGRLSEPELRAWWKAVHGGGAPDGVDVWKLAGALLHRPGGGAGDDAGGADGASARPTPPTVGIEELRALYGRYSSLDVEETFRAVLEQVRDTSMMSPDRLVSRRIWRDEGTRPGGEREGGRD
jgi:hypothetical protein